MSLQAGTLLSNVHHQSPASSGQAEHQSGYDVCSCRALMGLELMLQEADHLLQQSLPVSPVLRPVSRRSTACFSRLITEAGADMFICCCSASGCALYSARAASAAAAQAAPHQWSQHEPAEGWQLASLEPASQHTGHLCAGSPPLHHGALGARGQLLRGEPDAVSLNTGALAGGSLLRSNRSGAAEGAHASHREHSPP